MVYADRDLGGGGSWLGQGCREGNKQWLKG